MRLHTQDIGSHEEELSALQPRTRSIDAVRACSSGRWDAENQALCADCCQDPGDL